MTVADNSKVYIKADLQPKYYSVLKDIVSANIKNINDDKVYSLEDLSGRLLSYGNPQVQAILLSRLLLK